MRPIPGELVEVARAFEKDHGREMDAGDWALRIAKERGPLQAKALELDTYTPELKRFDDGIRMTFGERFTAAAQLWDYDDLKRLPLNRPHFGLDMARWRPGNEVRHACRRRSFMAARYFNDLDVEEAEKAVWRRRRRAEPPASLPGPPALEFEPLVITKSESWPAAETRQISHVREICPPSDNAAYLAEAVACGRLSRVMVVTARGARTVYASPGFAKYLSGTVGDK
jgi:hypothetical protein